MTKKNHKKIYIGVTGHRLLPAPEKTRLAVQGVIREILNNAVGSRIPILISPLAEGADRLVANEFLQVADSRLHVPLPLAVSEYEKDFQTAESKKEFHDLLARACSSKILPGQNSRAAAYQAVGLYVVEHADIMLAVWNGKNAKGQGGTGDIVAYCRKLRKPLYWLNSKAPQNICRENTESKL